MTHCYQLSINEREEISLGLAQGFGKNDIGCFIDLCVIPEHGSSCSCILHESLRVTLRITVITVNFFDLCYNYIIGIRFE